MNVSDENMLKIFSFKEKKKLCEKFNENDAIENSVF